VFIPGLGVYVSGYALIKVYRFIEIRKIAVTMRILLVEGRFKRFFP
jgi:hypothetical protein